MSAQTPVDPGTAAPPASPLAALVLALVFAALFALAELSAISNLIALPEWYSVLGIADATPWALLVVGVALPVVLYVAALILGRRGSLLTRGLIWAACLGTTHALALSLFTLVSLLQPAIA